MTELIDKLSKKHSLSLSEYETLINNFTHDTAEYAAKLSRKVRESVYGNKVFIRGLVEISNICKNDCYYCGIRRSNSDCQRYRLSEKEILSCCENGYALGFRTFVFQGGEDAFFSDSFLIPLIEKIKKLYPECAVTLSLGERSKESYKALKDAGADRYLLRHETVDEKHYSLLHPDSMSHAHRLECLEALRNVGFQVGCGFMVGSPYQTNEILARELKFIEEFRPDMCGIGPFIPHKSTRFCNESAGSVGMTLFLLSLIRLIHPVVLLPATTALNTLSETGRRDGIMAGANVVMPNLSPVSVREKYTLYDNKKISGNESAEELEALKTELLSINHTAVVDRGDVERKYND